MSRARRAEWDCSDARRVWVLGAAYGPRRPCRLCILRLTRSIESSGSRHELHKSRPATRRNAPNISREVRMRSDTGCRQGWKIVGVPSRGLARGTKQAAHAAGPNTSR